MCQSEMPQYGVLTPGSPAYRRSVVVPGCLLPPTPTRIHHAAASFHHERVWCYRESAADAGAAHERTAVPWAALVAAMCLRLLWLVGCHSFSQAYDGKGVNSIGCCERVDIRRSISSSGSSGTGSSRTNSDSTNIRNDITSSGNSSSRHNRNVNL